MLEVLSPLEAARPLAGHFAAVSPLPLALGIAFQLIKLGVLSRVWLRIVRAAYPGIPIRARDAVVPYMVGTGANAVLPAKAGLATRIVLARRSIPRASYETLAGTMVAESLVGIPPMLLIIAGAAASGLLPSALGGITIAAPAWLTAPAAGVAAIGAVATALVAGLTAPRVRRRAAESWARGRRGLGIVSSGPALRRALLGQAAAWCCRLASIACFLAAFGLAPSPRLIALVVIAQVLATLVPIGPSGVGAQQALIVVALAGVASTETALAFSVGMQAAVILADVLAGAAALVTAAGWSVVGRQPSPAGPMTAPTSAGS